MNGILFDYVMKIKDDIPARFFIFTNWINLFSILD